LELLAEFPLVFASETSDEGGHGFVGTASLHLEISGFGALALAALKHP
jgi:hypothetical protein